MGTLSFNLKVGSMRKAQDFIVYPMSELQDKISIQSSKKFGLISIEDGRGILSKGNGNTFMHLRRDMADRNVITFKLTSSQLEELKDEIRKTGGSKVGDSVVFSDNSGASLLAKGGEIETKREFIDVVNQVKEENEAFPNDFVNVMDSINAILQDRGYEEFDEYTYDVRDEILDRYEKKVLDKQGLRFAKGGIIEEWSIQTDNEDEHFDNEKDAREFWESLSNKERKSGQYFRKSYFRNQDGELEEDEVEIIEQFAKGGKTQGYNDKLDESLGNTKGKRSTKEQNYKDRRNESEAMEKKGGKRKYARVKTMDKGNRKKKMKTPMTLAKVIRREGEKWQDAVKRASAMIRKDS